MCGMYGWNLKRCTPTLHVANAVLAQAMSARGTDSWGVLVDDTLKRGLDSITYTPVTQSLPNHRNVLAHTRYGTTGKITVGNAHPFVIGNIIGMHNGIIDNHDYLNRKYERNLSVDSQHIFAHINDGIDLSELVGYGAIVYTYTDKVDTVFMGRFNDGDLSVAKVKDKSGVIGIMWASTRSALKGAIQLAGLTASYYNIVEGMLYRVSQGKISIVGEHLTMLDIPKKTYSNSYSNTSWRTSSLSTTDYDDDEPWSDFCSTCVQKPGDGCACEDCVCTACQAEYYKDWMTSYDDVVAVPADITVPAAVATITALKNTLSTYS